MLCMVLAVGHISIRGARGIPRAPSGPAGDVLPLGNVQSNSSVCASWMPHLWSNFCRLVLLLQLRWFIPFLLYVYLAPTFYGAVPLFLKSEHFPWLAYVSLSTLAPFLLQFSLSSRTFMTSSKPCTVLSFCCWWM